MKELNKTVHDLKMEVETIKKSKRETTLGLENLGKISGVIGASITNRIQEIEERISGAEDTIENIDTTVKENTKAPNPKHPKNPGHMRRGNLMIIGIEEIKESQLKGPVNIFNEIIEENFLNLKSLTQRKRCP